jgi:FtsP/CotA-like multicopper oxidase with cupredoxin domain
MGRNSRRVVGVTLVACVALALTASVASAKATTKFSVTVTDNFAIPPIRFEVTDPPSEADRYKIQLINDSIGPHVWVAFGGLPAGFTEADLIAALDSDTPPAGAFPAGEVFAKPGQKHQKKFDFTVPGRYAFFCPIPTPGGIPHYQLGFAGVFDVAP